MNIQPHISDHAYKLKGITELFQTVLEDNLVGIYLHGSLAMGGFNPEQSDIDLLIVVQDAISQQLKLDIAQKLLIVEEDLIYGNGLELSILLQKDINPFVYPTPFEFHYSAHHREKYRTDTHYICGGDTDTDIAAHIFVTYHRGLTLYGKQISAVFAPIDPHLYIQSLLLDIEHVSTDIIDSPVYYTLNLCRILLFLQEHTVSSKKEGGEWGISALPSTYSELIRNCLDMYSGSIDDPRLEPVQLQAFAEYIVNEIQQQLSDSTV